MAKTRSPNYPSISFADAVLKARTVWEKEYQHPTPKEVVARTLGYGGLNGASLSLIAALLRYGLLEQRGENLCVSDDAVTLFIEEKGSRERAQAIQRMAFAPAVFSDLRAYYGDRLPSDASLTTYLIRKGFTPRSASDVLRSYRDTLAFVRDESNGADLSSNEPERKLPVMPAPSLTTLPENPTTGEVISFPWLEAAASGQQELAFKIGEDCWSRTFFQGRVTQEAIEKLIALLDLSKDAFPKREQCPSEAVSSSETQPPSSQSLSAAQG